jgi:hypothetical protein
MTRADLEHHSGRIGKAVEQGKAMTLDPRSAPGPKCRELFFGERFVEGLIGQRRE